MKWLVLWIVSFIFCFFLFFSSFIGFIVSIVWMGFVSFLLVWLYLAPNNMFFTFIKEGHAKIVVRAGQFHKALINWQGRTFSYKKSGDDRWEIVEGNETHLFGGLRLYSLFWPLDKIYTYDHRWTHLHSNGEIVSHQEHLDFVFLKEDMYVVRVDLRDEAGMEDINGMPIGITILLPMKIVNPYIATFRVRRWLPMITGVVQARLRRFVANYRYKEDLLNMTAGHGIKEAQQKSGVPYDKQVEVGTDIWAKFLEELEQDFRKEGAKIINGQNQERIIKIYGIEINEKGAGLFKVDPSNEYRKFTTMAYEAETNRTRKEIEAEARSAETIGTLISMMAKAQGRKPEEVAEDIKNNPNAQREFLELSRDLLIRKMGIEGNAYLDIRTSSAEPGKTLIDLVGAWLRMPTGLGVGGVGTKTRKKEQRKKKDPEYEEYEEEDDEEEDDNGKDKSKDDEEDDEKESKKTKKEEKFKHKNYKNNKEIKAAWRKIEEDLKEIGIDIDEN